MARSTIGVLLWATAAAYVALWLGGAIELLTHDDLPDGPGCYVSAPWGGSSAAMGTEQSEWLGGGILGRPGRVCILDPDDVVSFQPDGIPPQLAADLADDGTATFPVFTDLDLLSALAAVGVFGVVVVSGAVWVIRKRRSDTRRANRPSVDAPGIAQQWPT